VVWKPRQMLYLGKPQDRTGSPRPFFTGLEAVSVQLTHPLAFAQRVADKPLVGAASRREEKDSAMPVRLGLPLGEAALRVMPPDALAVRQFPTVGNPPTLLLSETKANGNGKAEQDWTHRASSSLQLFAKSKIQNWYHAVPSQNSALSD